MLHKHGSKPTSRMCSNWISFSRLYVSELPPTFRSVCLVLSLVSSFVQVTPQWQAQHWLHTSILVRILPYRPGPPTRGATAGMQKQSSPIPIPHPGPGARGAKDKATIEPAYQGDQIHSWTRAPLYRVLQFL